MDRIARCLRGPLPPAQQPLQAHPAALAPSAVAAPAQPQQLPPLVRSSIEAPSVRTAMRAVYLVDADAPHARSAVAALAAYVLPPSVLVVLYSSQPHAPHIRSLFAALDDGRCDHAAPAPRRLLLVPVLPQPPSQPLSSVEAAIAAHIHAVHAILPQPAAIVVLARSHLLPPDDPVRSQRIVADLPIPAAPSAQPQTLFPPHPVHNLVAHFMASALSSFSQQQSDLSTSILVAPTKDIQPIEESLAWYLHALSVLSTLPSINTVAMDANEFSAHLGFNDQLPSPGFYHHILNLLVMDGVMKLARVQAPWPGTGHRMYMIDPDILRQRLVEYELTDQAPIDVDVPVASTQSSASAAESLSRKRPRSDDDENNTTSGSNQTESYKNKLASFMAKHFPSTGKPEYTTVQVKSIMSTKTTSAENASSDSDAQPTSAVGYIASVRLPTGTYESSTPFATSEDACEDAARFACEFMDFFLEAARGTESLGDDRLETFVLGSKPPLAPSADTNHATDSASRQRSAASNTNHVAVIKSYAHRRRIPIDWRLELTPQAHYRCTLVIDGTQYVSSSAWVRRDDAREDAARVACTARKIADRQIMASQSEVARAALKRQSPVKGNAASSASMSPERRLTNRTPSIAGSDTASTLEWFQSAEPSTPTCASEKNPKQSHASPQSKSASAVPTKNASASAVPIKNAFSLLNELCQKRRYTMSVSFETFSYGAGAQKTKKFACVILVRTSLVEPTTTSAMAAAIAGDSAGSLTSASVNDGAKSATPAASIVMPVQPLMFRSEPQSKKAIAKVKAAEIALSYLSLIRSETATPDPSAQPSADAPASSLLALDVHASDSSQKQQQKQMNQPAAAAQKLSAVAIKEMSPVDSPLAELPPLDIAALPSLPPQTTSATTTSALAESVAADASVTAVASDAAAHENVSEPAPVSAPSMSATTASATADLVAITRLSDAPSSPRRDTDHTASTTESGNNASLTAVTNTVPIVNASSSSFSSGTTLVSSDDVGGVASGAVAEASEQDATKTSADAAVGVAATDMDVVEEDDDDDDEEDDDDESMHPAASAGDASASASLAPGNAGSDRHEHDNNQSSAAGRQRNRSNKRNRTNAPRSGRDNRSRRHGGAGGNRNGNSGQSGRNQRGGGRYGSRGNAPPQNRPPFGRSMPPALFPQQPLGSMPSLSVPPSIQHIVQPVLPHQSAAQMPVHVPMPLSMNAAPPMMFAAAAAAAAAAANNPHQPMHAGASGSMPSLSSSLMTGPPPLHQNRHQPFTSQPQRGQPQQRHQRQQQSSYGHAPPNVNMAPGAGFNTQFGNQPQQYGHASMPSSSAQANWMAAAAAAAAAMSMPPSQQQPHQPNQQQYGPFHPQHQRR